MSLACRANYASNSHVSKDWQGYQNQVAEFFKRLGFDAKVDHKVCGARARHAVDVWVTFEHYGIEVRWLVECKLWNSSIPKEKVLALIQIAQDVGADKAFLLTEKGFQSGAINAAKNTNVILSSLETLEANAVDEIAATEIVLSAKRLHEANERLRAMVSMVHSSGKVKLDQVIEELGIAFGLQHSVNKAIVGKYPIVLLGSKDGLSCDNSTAFAKVLKVEVDQLYAATAFLETQCYETGELKRAADALFKTLLELMVASEKALFESREGDAGFEEDRLAALGLMKELGRAFEACRLATPRNATFEALSELRQTLVDTVYLHLTHPTIERETWDATRLKVKQRMDAFDRLVGAG